jgi:hypothetical protein
MPDELPEAIFVGLNGAPAHLTRQKLFFLMRGLKTPQISQIYTEKSVVISVISGNILWFKIFVASSAKKHKENLRFFLRPQPSGKFWPAMQRTAGRSSVTEWLNTGKSTWRTPQNRQLLWPANEHSGENRKFGNVIFSYF